MGLKVSGGGVRPLAILIFAYESANHFAAGTRVLIIDSHAVVVAIDRASARDFGVGWCGWKFVTTTYNVTIGQIFEMNDSDVI